MNSNPYAQNTNPYEQPGYNSNLYGRDNQVNQQAPMLQDQNFNIYDKEQIDATGTLQQNARLNFIKKVYSILAIQFVLTTLMILMSMYVPAFFNFQNRSWATMIIAAVFIIVTEITIICCKVGRMHPYNLILLGIFTLGEAYMISFICAITGQTSGNQIVLVAGAMTAGITIAISAYACFTKTDFTISYGIIIVILVSMMFFGIFALVFRGTDFPILYNLYCALGVILFGIYLLIDTQMIIGGKRYEISLDDHVIAAMLLYIDIIQIFLYLLRILGKN